MSTGDQDYSIGMMGRGLGMGEPGKVCQHGSLARQCYTCELESERDTLKADCIRLQQEINCLRMEPCQLPKCVQEQARGSRLQKALKDCAKEPPPCLMCKQALVEEEARKG